MFWSANTIPVMEEDPPLIQCPLCGSVLTGPLKQEGLWECRYHLCHAIFRMPRVQSPAHGMTVAEKEVSYRADGQDNRGMEKDR
jgi:hypothetical protein